MFDLFFASLCFFLALVVSFDFCFSEFLRLRRMDRFSLWDYLPFVVSLLTFLSCLSLYVPLWFEVFQGFLELRPFSLPNFLLFAL
jgi:hypothetical protein